MSIPHIHDEYIARINKVIDYIEEHIDKQFTLEELSKVASFSQFHFHRIFASMTGETLYQFIQRIRLEKAAGALVKFRKKSVTEVALDYGFSSSATFARAFKDKYGKSATEWRENLQSMANSNKRKTDSNIRNPLGNVREADYSSTVYIDPVNRKQKWRITMKNGKPIETNVVVNDMPEMTVAYVRHVGKYQGDPNLFQGLYEQLMKWAGPRGLLEQPDLKMMNIYHDNPEITDDDKLRLSVCLTVPANTEVSGEIGKMTIPGGKYAVAGFEIDVDQYQDAWDTVCGAWLPESGYEPAEGPSYELCKNNPEEHPDGKHVIDICVPVKPL